jgi:hypothetical protein
MKGAHVPTGFKPAPKSCSHVNPLAPSTVGLGSSKLLAEIVPSATAASKAKASL